MQGYVGPIIVSQVDGTALTNSTAATSLLPGQAKPTMAAGYIDTVGKAFRVKAFGRISTLVTTPGTLKLDLMLGNVIVATGGTMVLSTTAKANVSWWLDWMLTARAVGSGTSANFMHGGLFVSEAAGSTSIAGQAGSILLPQSAPAVGTGFDSTAAETWDLFATWSVANASNSILCHMFSIESLN